MRVRVTVPVFKNKVTGTYHAKGEVISITKERYEDIRKAGPFVELVKSRAQKPETNTDSDSSEQAPAEEPEPGPAPLHSVEGIAYIEDIRK